MADDRDEKGSVSPTRRKEILGERIDRAKYTYELVNGWIENADAKVATSCGLFAGVIAAFTFLSECLAKVSNPSTQTVANECWDKAHTFLLVTGIVSFLGAVACYADAITPNLKSAAHGTSKRHFLLYYGDIADVSVEEFGQCMRRAPDAAFLDEIVRETHHNAGVCARKMKRYRIGIWLSLGAVALVGLSWIAHLLAYVK